MKCYIQEHRIELVGKGWEIRNHLKQLLKKSGNPHTLLKDYLTVSSRQAASAAAHTPRKKAGSAAQSRPIVVMRNG